MGLRFRRCPATDEISVHHVAVGGRAWPHQWRYEIEKSGSAWYIAMSAHVPGRGFVAISGRMAKTLKQAIAICDAHVIASQEENHHA